MYAEKRTIYAAYLFEKMFYGEDFSEEEYARKEEAFKVLDKAERAEVEDAIVEQLEKLRLARKKINNYYQSQTLAAKLASGEVIVRPDWKVGNVEESEEDASNLRYQARRMNNRSYVTEQTTALHLIYQKFN